MDIKIITAIISSSVLASFVTAFFTKFSKDKTNKLTYITNERKKWRDDLREATVTLRRLFENNKANKPGSNRTENFVVQKQSLIFQSYNEAKTYFQVRLNPNDKEDNNILRNFDGLNEDKLKTIEIGIARLLKHDWERAKKETQGKSVFVKIFLAWIILLTIYHLYPIKEWVGITSNSKEVVFSFNSVVMELISFKTIILIILIPIITKIANGLFSCGLKLLSIDSRHETKKSAICSWLNIPYREPLNK